MSFASTRTPHLAMVFKPPIPTSRMCTSSTFQSWRSARIRISPRDLTMALFWEFFTFELRFRFKSLSTYVYFALWLTFSFLNVAARNFGPLGGGNGKVLLNSAYANTYNDLGSALFGIIVIAAIFGTSILR